MTGWSRVVGSPEQARGALADPGDALDLRAPAQLDGAWQALGFAPLVPGELVRPVPAVLRAVEDTEALGARLAAGLRPGDLVLLSGPLGAGKTALARGLGRALGVQGAVTSPTFVLARVHRGPVPLVHVDAYRLREVGGPDARLALDDLDLDADLPGSVVVVEWGEGLAEGLSEARVEVRLERPPADREAPALYDGTTEGADGPRTATVRVHGRRWAVVHAP